MYVYVLCSLLKMKFLNAIHTDYSQKVKTGFSLAILKKEMFHLVYLWFHKTFKELHYTYLFQKQFAIKMETFEWIYAQMGTLLLPTYIKLTVPLID